MIDQTLLQKVLAGPGIDTKGQQILSSLQQPTIQPGGNLVASVIGAPTIPNPTPVPTPTITTAGMPELPTPTAPVINQQFTTSLSADLEKSRQAVEDSYKTQIADLNVKMAESQKKIEDLNTLQQENVIKNVEELSKPFRQQLEETERQRLYITENFEANQKLTNELDSLLTQGNEIIAQTKELAIPEVFRKQRVNQTINDINARASVINSVMSARNNQISQAYNLIDRGVAAISADRQDQLAYYQTLNNFYENQKDAEGNKLISLDKEQKTYIQSQIGLLESDLSQATKNADYIKSLMTSPESALLVAEAGISLSDTPEQVNQKLATQIQRDNIEKTKNQYVSQGYEFVPFPQLQGGDNLMTISVGGQKLSFKKPIEIIAGGGLTPSTRDEVAIKPATAAQQTTAGYAARAEQADSLIQNLQDNITGMSYIGYKIQTWLPSAFQGSTYQQYDQAARNFINSVLRPESGAAIAQSEFDNAYKQYIPTAGDSAGTIAQKADNRKLKIESLKQASGNAYTSASDLLKGNVSQTSQSETYVAPDGTEYVKGEDGLYYPI